MGALGNLWSRLFGTKNESASKLNTLNIFSPNFSTEAKKEFNATFEACIGAHSAFVSKICPVVYENNDKADKKAYLNRIIGLKPNPVMNASQFYKAVARSYYGDNLVVIWPNWKIENGQRKLTELWPLDIDTISTATTESGQVAIKFRVNGKEYYKLADDLIILQREVDIRKLFQGNSKALERTLKVIQTGYEGLEQAIITSQYIRFIVRSATMLNDEVLKKRQEDFAKRLNGNGALYVDGSEEIKEVNSNGKWPQATEMSTLKEDIYEFEGITPNIIKGDFTEIQWQSYYERSIEPLCVELAQELTIKLFNEAEQLKGYSIRIITSPLQTATLETRIKIAQAAIRLPQVVVNDILELLYLPAMEGGDKPQSSLNWVEGDKKNDYQGVGSKDPKKEDPKEDDQNGKQK